MPSPKKPYPYPGAGRCIYCGDDKSALSDEHIIAFALDGEHAIEAASCPTCSKCTCRAEGICLGDMFKAARTRFKMSSRRRRPHELAVTYVEGGKTWTVDVPVGEHPTTIFMVAGPPPRMLRSLFPPKSFEMTHIWVHGDGANIDKIRKRTHKRRKILIGSFHELAFARMLAKIGHSFAVARLGIDGFEPVLTDLIRERSNEYADFVGGDPRPSPRKSVKHQMQLNRLQINGVEYAVVAIQIFAKFGAPVFQVVVGQTKRAKQP